MSMSPAKKPTQKKTSPKKSAAPEGETSAKKPTPTKPSEMCGEVMDFITAIDDYKRIHGRPFPSWSEVLDIVKALGYSRSA
jgi:hypothetical protein